MVRTWVLLVLLMAGGTTFLWAGDCTCENYRQACKHLGVCCNFRCEQSPPPPGPVSPTPDELQQKQEQAMNEANDEGEAYFGKGDWANAIYYFEKALEFSPDDPTILHNLRRAREEANRERSDSSYLREVAPAAACFVQTMLRSTDTCEVIEATQLGLALERARSAEEFWKLILMEAAEKEVALMFPEDMNVEAKIRIAKSLYEWESQAFADISRLIIKEIADNPKKNERREIDALRHARGIEALKQQIINEQQTNVRASEKYLRRHPHSSGIRFRCSTACRQLIEAAKDTKVWSKKQ